MPGGEPAQHYRRAVPGRPARRRGAGCGRGGSLRANARLPRRWTDLAVPREAPTACLRGPAPRAHSARHDRPDHPARARPGVHAGGDRQHHEHPVARLGRIVDRSRMLQERHGATEGTEHDMIVREIRLIDRRIAPDRPGDPAAGASGPARRVDGGAAVSRGIRRARPAGLVVAGAFIARLGAADVGAAAVPARNAARRPRRLRIPETYLELDREALAPRCSALRARPSIFWPDLRIAPSTIGSMNAERGRAGRSRTPPGSSSIFTCAR